VFGGPTERGCISECDAVLYKVEDLVRNDNNAPHEVMEVGSPFQMLRHFPLQKGDVLLRESVEVGVNQNVLRRTVFLIAVLCGKANLVLGDAKRHYRRRLEVDERRFLLVLDEVAGVRK